MKIVRTFIVLLALLASPGAQVSAIEVVPSPPPAPPQSPLLVTEFRTFNSQVDYIQLHNNGSEAIFLPDWKLVNTYGDGSGAFEITFPVGYLPPNRYIVLSADSAALGSLVQELGAAEEFVSSDVFSLVSTTQTFAPEPVPIATGEQNLRYHRYKSSSGNYTATRSFSKLSDQAAPLLSDGLYLPRLEFPLSPIEILPNAKNCSPEDVDLACGDYVKFYNHTEAAVDFTGTRLRIGYQGQATSEQNTIVLSGTIQPGEYAVFSATASGSRLSLTNSGAFVWLEDTYGVERYQNTTVEYPDASSRKGRAWAISEGSQWYWAVPNPSGKNIEEEPVPEKSISNERELVPCQPDQFRNPTTNRCNKITVPIESIPCNADQERNPDTGRCRKINTQDALKPCAPDQERNEETGRCRKITGSAGTLTPCKAGQERNPDTNRCRSAVQASTSLKPCASGQERNPDTNRCRKVKVDTVRSDFGVEAMEASRDTIASWWALGGIGSLALGYAGWEWRVEVVRTVRRMRELFTFGR